MLMVMMTVAAYLQNVHQHADRRRRIVSILGLLACTYKVGLLVVETQLADGATFAKREPHSVDLSGSIL